MLPSSGLLECPWVCAINSPLFFIEHQYSSSAHLALLHLLLPPPLMGPKRGVGMTGRGRVRRGRGSRTPRSSRGGRGGASSVPSSSSSEEGFWRYDFLLRVHGRSAARILLPPAFAAIVSELSLTVLLLRLQGCVR